MSYRKNYITHIICIFELYKLKLSLMEWVWQNKKWPIFEFDGNNIADFERKFIQNSGRMMGTIQHLEVNNLEILKIELLSQEAISTSIIEGEILNRDSVQSSIRRHLGLKSDYRKVPPNASGVSEMMVNLYLNYNVTLTHETLFEWHKMLMNGRRDVEIIGGYRQHTEPMQIISGNYNTPKIFYEAPPSSKVFSEMDRFLQWFNQKLLDNSLPTLIFAGIAHLYFEMIHPFEDGNGRLGRALVEKAISLRLQSPALNSLSKVIDQEKKEYYAAIQTCNNQLNINDYLKYFSELVLKSQDYSYKMVNFLIFKTKFYSKFQNVLNARQEKVISRIFDEGLEGFKGGLSAGNYKTITSASNATTTRDLQGLLELNAITKTGELKHTRYFLNNKI
jgi:Fic family protein